MILVHEYVDAVRLVSSTPPSLPCLLTSIIQVLGSSQIEHVSNCTHVIFRRGLHFSLFPKIFGSLDAYDGSVLERVADEGCG